MILAGAYNDANYMAIVLQLRLAWDNRDLRERVRPKKVGDPWKRFRPLERGSMLMFGSWFSFEKMMNGRYIGFVMTTGRWGVVTNRTITHGTNSLGEAIWRLRPTRISFLLLSFTGR